MLKIKATLVFLLLACSGFVASEGIDSADREIYSGYKKVKYTSSVEVTTKISEVKDGVQVFKKADGTCYKVTYRIIEMRKSESTVPGISIEQPVTQKDTEIVGCGIKIEKSS